jgi:hypothetical protein
LVGNAMNIEEIEYIRQDFKDDLLEHLLGTVFHLTTKTAFEQIKNDGYVYHNQNGRLGLNPSSEKSFGRNKGWVCLFDLRDETSDSIEETLMKYWFLAPSWFAHLEREFKEFNLAYLLLHPDEYWRLIPNEIADMGQYIPKEECWFLGNMPLRCLKKILLVRIIEAVPKDNWFLYAQHLHEMQRKKKIT